MMNANEFRMSIVIIIVVLLIGGITALMVDGGSIVDMGDGMGLEDHFGGLNWLALNIGDWSGRECLIVHIWVDDTDYRETILECE